MSISVAAMLEGGKTPITEAALIKDLGNTYERLVPELIRVLAPVALVNPIPEHACINAFSTRRLLPCAVVHGKFCAGVIARGLGLR